VVGGQPDAVGVERHRPDRPFLGHVDEREDVLVNGRFAAGEHHDLGLALTGDERVEHGGALVDGDRVPVGLVPGVGETDRAVQVAVRVDLDDAEAGVLFVLGAQPAVQRAPLAYLGLYGQRDGPGLVEPRRVDVHLCVAVDQRLELAVVAAPLPQVDLPIADVDLGIDHGLAHRADRLGELDEHLVPVALHDACASLDHGNRPYDGEMLPTVFALTFER